MKLKYTGERVIPNQMHNDPINLTLHLHRYIFALPYVINKDCLDVACGTGYGMALISMLAKSVTGVDKDKKTIKWAEKNNHFYTRKVKFLNINLNKDKEILHGKYDTILSFETIEHLDSQEAFLRKIKTALKPGGQLVISTPVNEPTNPFHKHFFTWQSLAHLVEFVFGKNIEWYSQKVNSIRPGKDEKALFAICIIQEENSVLKIKIKKAKYLLGKTKSIIYKRVKNFPQSRW